MNMLMESKDYFAQRLRCTDAEKDACLETVVQLLHLWDVIYRDGILAIGFARADQEPDPFFRACLRDASDLMGTENELLMEDLFKKYLTAGDYRGGDFLRNVVIAEGILAISKVVQSAGMEDFRKWGERLSLAVRGYFGADWRDKVDRAIVREVCKYEYALRKTSLVPEFDTLAELPLCAKLWQEVPKHTMETALKYAGAAVRERIMSALPADEREQVEDEIELISFLQNADAEAAQREVLEKATRYQS